MMSRLMLSKLWLTSAIITLLGFVAGASAQPAAPPDFWAGEGGWVHGAGATFPPIAGGPSPVVQDPAYPFISQGATWRLGDVSNPNLKQWAKDIMKKDNDEIRHGKIEFQARSSCLPSGVPNMFLPGNALLVLQTPKQVVMIKQGGQEVRHIYLNVPHRANVIPSWFGDSVGHYEGDTLVVDTIGLNDKTFVDDFLTPHTDKLHVVERLRLTDGGKGMLVDLHVQDEGAFAMAWDAIQRYRRVEPGVAEHNLVIENDATSGRGVAGPLIEYICAENPISYFGKDAIPLPQADKPDF